MIKKSVWQANIFLFCRYKDGVILDMSSEKYLIEAKAGIHTLEIPR